MTVYRNPSQNKGNVPGSNTGKNNAKQIGKTLSFLLPLVGVAVACNEFGTDAGKTVIDSVRKTSDTTVVRDTTQKESPVDTTRFDGRTLFDMGGKWFPSGREGYVIGRDTLVVSKVYRKSGKYVCDFNVINADSNKVVKTIKEVGKNDVIDHNGTKLKILNFEDPLPLGSSRKAHLELVSVDGLQSSPGHVEFANRKFHELKEGRNRFMVDIWSADKKKGQDKEYSLGPVDLDVDIIFNGIDGQDFLSANNGRINMILQDTVRLAKDALFKYRNARFSDGDKVSLWVKYENLENKTSDSVAVDVGEGLYPVTLSQLNNLYNVDITITDGQIIEIKGTPFDLSQIVFAAHIKMSADGKDVDEMQLHIGEGNTKDVKGMQTGYHTVSIRIKEVK
ncbi:MAG: hypothetical protein ABIH83_03170 [Candidatus Micrarchaeota archaeon]